jgi:hypothetical protein
MWMTQGHSRLLWLYGLKSKHEAPAWAGPLAASQRWMAEISELLDQYPLLVVMRDAHGVVVVAGENNSKEISDYLTSMEVKNYLRTAYKQHQDGLAESGVQLTLTLAWSLAGMAQSSLAGKCWFSAANCALDC